MSLINVSLTLLSITDAYDFQWIFKPQLFDRGNQRVNGSWCQIYRNNWTIVRFFFNPFANVDAVAEHKLFPVVPCVLSGAVVVPPPSFAVRFYHADDGRCSCDCVDC